ncbi:MAG: RNA methyltransferase, partial [Lachnospiraceae bacterium]|nr:RNA methyltransferase [Lachnospiraceae bacterium]
REEQDTFYGKFFESSQRHLEQNGIIILYSNENGFVKKQLRLNRNFKLLKEYCIRPKDGWFLFIIKMEK